MASLPARSPRPVLRQAAAGTNLVRLPGSRIPRTFHWLWLGPAPLPAAHRRWMESWMVLHPGWQGRVWTDDTLPELRNRAEFSLAGTWAQKADIARYEILLAQGGVYLDTDMECLRSIERLVDGLDAFAGRETPELVGNAVLGAAPAHEWMEAAVTGLPGAMREEWLTVDQTGPEFLTRLTARRSDVHVFAPEIFYPFASDERSGTRPVPPASYAIHHFAKSWALEERRRLGDFFGSRLAELVPPGTTMVLVPEWVEVPPFSDRTVRPFVERDGQDWGHPADDDQALLELDRHLRRGAEVIVFLDPARWWLEHYAGLAHRLKDAAISIHESAHLVAFWLTPQHGRPPGGRAGGAGRRRARRPSGPVGGRGASGEATG